MKVKVTAASDVTDLDYLKRRVEAFGFNVTRFGDELFVTEGPHTSTAAGFRLANLLHNNSPALIKFTVDTESSVVWEKEDAKVLHSDTLRQLEREGS